MLLLVKDKRTGLERTVTQKAYAAKGPQFYEKLRFVNDDGSEIEGQQAPNSKAPQVSRSVKGAGPVVVKTQLAQPKSVTQDSGEQKEQEQQESQDQAPAASASDTQQKPAKTGRKKSIPSSSDADGKLN
jgi:hypothetical protein